MGVHSRGSCRKQPRWARWFCGIGWRSLRGRRRGWWCVKLTRPSWLSGRRVQRAGRCVDGGGSGGGGGGGVVSVLGGGRPSSDSPHLIVELVWCWCFGLASLVAGDLPLLARVGFRVELQIQKFAGLRRLYPPIKQHHCRIYNHGRKKQ